ncbi:hypothetical protein HMH01_15675 [Halovulum dunhuangense]|uniref:Tetratricopeptide repeat-like domain-containing protein n=1 Tax=Halovulum dunhuangense TaxID=1505036 RepID=A0A849L669_9RHOB|nr:hypothetical protein [Halovulum dunhuangense]NNU81876.1 hypothetical protein [Halovulum dunhuangense]
MSQPDSFLDEVTEEVRRDQMIAFLRRNAVWIVAVVLLVVGGAGFLEWQKAKTRAEAQARGDALYAALQAEDPAARLEALNALGAEGAEAAALLDIARANAALGAGDRAQALALLEEVASRGAASEALRNVARLKYAAAGAGTADPAAREDMLLPMLADGHPLRAAALEQRALIRLEQGDAAAAVADLSAIANDETAPDALRSRAEQVIAIISADEAADG